MLGTLLQSGTWHQVDFDSMAISLTDKLVSFAGQISEGLSAIGVGIGAIMLLIVVLYYIASILDGGKFQLKMLVPVAIFFIVSNFSWIAKPVLVFTTTITESISETLYEMESSLKNSYELGPEAHLGDMHLKNMQMKTPDWRISVESYNQLIGEGASNMTDPTDESDGKMSDYVNTSTNTKDGQGGLISRSIGNAVNSEISKAIDDFSTIKSSEMQRGPELTWYSSLLITVLGCVCSAFSYVFKAFGAVMTSIVVAFGPITFAFAIMPGQGGTIKSWFIRMCQFALYSPLCSLINCFTTYLFDFMSKEGGAGGVPMSLGLIICSLVALLSIPSISSMIIEGATGAVSLSQGLQSIGSAMTTAGTLAGAGFTAVAGKDNKISTFMRGAQDMGASGMLRSYLGNSPDGGASSTGGGFSGMVSEAMSRGSQMQDWDKFGSSPQGQNNGGQNSGGQS